MVALAQRHTPAVARGAAPFARPLAFPDARWYDAAMEDLELVRSFKAGDRAAFDEIARRHWQRVYRLAWGFVRDAFAAEDLTQEVFVKIYTSLHRFREESALSTWIYRVTVNACRDLLRRRRPGETELDEALLASSAPRPEEEAAAGELRVDLSRAIAALPARQREVILLRHFEKLDVEETAKAMGCAEGTVKAAHFAAVRKLRGLLGRYRDAL
jgi:RNA polymerase sigma-70 factor (ECF subfamily)